MTEEVREQDTGEEVNVGNQFFNKSVVRVLAILC